MINSNEIVLKTTGDGSHTLFIPALQEHYHSWHGAITESLYVFIEQGLIKVLQNRQHLRILEVGMGTGLNTLLTVLHQQKNPAIHIHYTALEKYPLPSDLISQLNYTSQIGDDADSWFKKIHSSPWNVPSSLSNNFVLEKMDIPVQEFVFDQTYDLVYFDAFAPEKQAEMWIEEVFRKIYDLMSIGGVLVTYCAKGSFKRTLKHCGFEVETLPGPPGKREMVRGIHI